jgi:tetratricopeptide (TPR) repeat protein
MAEPIFERYKEALKLGHVATFKGRPKEALEHYQEAARLAGHRPLPYINIGSVLLQLGRPQEALAAYDEALQRAPEDREALRGKAAALLAAGKRSDATSLLQQVAELEAEDSRQRAEADATAQAAAWAGGPEPLMSAAHQAASAGNAAGAIEAYVAAAAGFAERNQLDAALDACLRGLALSLGAPSVHVQMARIYFQRGWTERAVDRMLLLRRLLVYENDPLAERGLRDLARLHRNEDPRLGQLAEVIS